MKEMHLRNSYSMAIALTFMLTGQPVLRAADGPWNAQAAAKYLDSRAEWWLTWSGASRGQGTACLSCHTTLPYALARPALDGQLGRADASPAEKRLIGVLEKRVENWDKIVAQANAESNPFVPFYSGKRRPSALGTESVLNALVLVNRDVRREKGALRPATRKALSHLWEQQQDNGAWSWLHFGLNPWENDGAYYGASLAALAVGRAGEVYFEQPALRMKVAALKKYLQTQRADQPLHHRVVLLWASSALPGILAPDAKAKLIAEILLAQEADGGWSLAKLGRKAPQKDGYQAHGVYPAGPSDGYATGLVVLALKRALPADDSKLQQGIRWLRGHEKEGTWPAAYPNRARDPQSDIGKFMRDAATGFAILGLSDPG
jgi:squalene-hopene/tetraprenyl-beta-curcumene cyclase